MIIDIVEYDLTGMAGEVLTIVNGEGVGPLTEAQRRKLDKIISKYAKRTVTIVRDHS